MLFDTASIVEALLTDTYNTDASNTASPVPSVSVLRRFDCRCVSEVGAMLNDTTSKPPTERITASIIPHVHAEPGPNWDEAKNLWGVAWGVHWLGFGLLFSSLAMSCLFALIQVQRKKGFGRKPLVVAINSLLLTLGVTRALYLFLDPYQSNENGISVPDWLSQLLFGIGFPCLTSSFGLIHLAFLEVTKLQLGSKRLQNVRFLCAVITVHFVVVLVVETSASLKPSLGTLIIVCQLFFILWGVLLSTSFIHSGLKVIHRAEEVRAQLASTRRKPNTAKVTRVTFGTSVLGFACSALQAYSLFGVYGFYSGAVHPAPWPWWVFQTCFRLVEVCMAGTMAYSVAQPSERNGGHVSGEAMKLKKRNQVKKQKLMDTEE